MIVGTRYFYLVVNDYNKNVNDFIIGNLKSSYLNKNILKIDNKGKFSMLYNEVECKNTQKNYFGPVNIEIKYPIVRWWGDIINLNHGFSIYLSFKMLY